MTRFANVVAAAAGAALVTPGLALAAEEVIVDTTPDLFSWYPEWGLGVLFGVSGLVGALVTVFFLVGGVLPGTAGAAKIDAAEARLERLEVVLERAATEPNSRANVGEVGKIVNDLRDDVRSDRWRQYVVASTLYSLLGAAFALFLAHDVLQGLVIGAGWTGFIGALGLRTDYAVRKDVKDQVITELQQVAEVDKAEDPAELKRSVRVAQAL